MTNVIVPNHIRDAINRTLDVLLAEVPEAAPDRERFFAELLSYFCAHGEMPEVSLVNNGANSAASREDV